MKYALVLDSLQDVQKFTEIVQQIDVDVRLLWDGMKTGVHGNCPRNRCFVLFFWGHIYSAGTAIRQKILTGMQSTVNVIMIFII